MCNHYRFKNPYEVLEFAAAWDHDMISDPDAVGFASDPLVEQTWPWKDNSTLPVVYSFDGYGKFDFMRWGTPNFANPRQGWVSNARDDRLLQSPTWKRLAARHRCLVAADGFYEPFGEVGAKREALFHLPDDEPFFFAGLWTVDPKDNKRCFAIVTGQPNAVVAALPHDRMPVILDEGGASAWLGSEPLAPDELLRLCAPYAGELLRVDQPPPERRSGKGKVSRSEVDTGELQLD